MYLYTNTCQQCSKPFNASKNNIKRGYGKFCSRECYHESQRTNKIPDIERFWKYVRKTETCWIWIGATPSSRGYYGEFIKDNKRKNAHRASYEFFVGTIPEGMFVCHTCDNPSCVNPEHLFLGTPKDNSKDRDDKGRNYRGETHHRAKITEKDVQRIREIFSEGEWTRSELAIMYDLSLSTICRIINRDYWKHVE